MAARKNGMLHAVADHGERAVDHTAVRVDPQRHAEVELAVRVEAVEEVAVVVVGIAAHRRRDRHRRLVHRIVVPRSYHACAPCSSSIRPTNWIAKLSWSNPSASVISCPSRINTAANVTATHICHHSRCFTERPDNSSYRAAVSSPPGKPGRRATFRPSLRARSG